MTRRPSSAAPSGPPPPRPARRDAANGRPGPPAWPLHGLVAGLVGESVVAGVHDCSDGGLAVALAEMAIGGGCGFEVASEGALAGLIPSAACFSESANRVVMSVGEARVDEVLCRAPRPACRRPCSARPAATGSCGPALQRRSRRRRRSLARRSAAPCRRVAGRLTAGSGAAGFERVQQVVGNTRSPRPVPSARSGL